MVGDPFVYTTVVLLIVLAFQHCDVFFQLIFNIHTIIRPSRNNGSNNDLQIAVTAFKQYAVLSKVDLRRMRHIYGSMTWKHKNIGYKLGYPSKLNRLAETIDSNAGLAQHISEMAGINASVPLSQQQKNRALEQMREVLKQLVREWSTEGAEERAQTFSPILDIFKDIPPQKRAETSVLVPGAGLARLAWEIANMGLYQFVTVILLC